MCQCIDVLCVCIHDIYLYLIKKEWRSSFYTSFDLYEYKVHNEAIPQPLMFVEIQIQVLHFPNNARLLCMYIESVGGLSRSGILDRLPNCDKRSSR